MCNSEMISLSGCFEIQVLLSAIFFASILVLDVAVSLPWVPEIVLERFTKLLEILKEE